MCKKMTSVLLIPAKCNPISCIKLEGTSEAVAVWYKSFSSVFKLLKYFFKVLEFLGFLSERICVYIRVTKVKH